MMQPPRQISRQTGNHVLVLGDLILDEYRHCRKRQSPNENIPVLTTTEQIYLPGNAANISRLIAAMGGKTIVCGVIGLDMEGNKLLQLIQSHCSSPYIMRLADRATSLKTRLVVDGVSLLRADTETNRELSRKQALQLQAMLEDAARRAKCFVLSDLGKGVYSPQVIRFYLELGKKLGVPVLVDPAGDDPDLYRGATVLSPNLDEYNRLNRSSYTDSLLAAYSAQSFVRTYQLHHMLLKAGSEGAYWISAEGIYHMPALCSRPVSCVGAGDSFLAAFTASLVNGDSYMHCFAFANAAAAVSVSKRYTPLVSREEVTDFVRSLPDDYLAYLTRL